MLTKRFSYPVADCWDPIPIVYSLEEGIVLDGYWKSEADGFYVIIYDLQKDKLVRYLDVTQHPHVLVKNGKDSGSNEKTEKLKRYYALEDQTIEITKVSTTKENIYWNNSINYKFHKPLNRSINPNLVYFHETGLTPGEKISIKNKRFVKLVKQEENRKIRDELLGEAREIIELAEKNMPIFEQSIPNIKRAAFDIEVKVPVGIFPIIEKAEYPIHAVGLYDNEDSSIMYIYGFEPTMSQKKLIHQELGYVPKIKSFIFEEEMLLELFSDLKGYPLLLTYNGDNFDLPYLKNRALRLGIEKKDIPIHQGFQSYRPQYHIAGTIHLDLFRFFSNNAVRIYAFGAKYTRLRLDDVANALLGYKKIEHDLWFDEMSRDQMVSYTVRDVELTLRLTTYSNNLALALMIMIMRVGKLSITSVNRDTISQWVLNWIAFEHAQRGWILPSKKDLKKQKGTFESEAGMENKQFKGAIVLDPEPGIYWDVTVADYASLYPSVIKKYNLSYETIRCQHELCIENRLNYVPELGHWVCLKKQGIMSSMVGYVRDIRVSWYKPQSKNGNTKEKREIAKTVEQALKVFINASYGVFGNSRFPLFCPPVAESTTAYARHALLEAKRVAEEYGFSVIYGDTDSIFIHNIDEQKFNKIKLWSIVNLGIPLSIDYKFRYLILSNRKKNYFGVTHNGKMIVKGLQVKKANTAIFIREIFEEIKKDLIEVENQKELEIAIQKMIITLRYKQEEIKNGNIQLQKLAKVLTLRKNFDEYESVTPAVQIALQEMTPENEEEYQQGKQFMGVSIIPKGIEIQTSKFANFPSGYQRMVSFASVKNVSKMEINWEKYIEQLSAAFKPILDAFDLDWERNVNRKTSLDEFGQDCCKSIMCNCLPLECNCQKELNYAE